MSREKRIRLVSVGLFVAVVALLVTCDRERETFWVSPLPTPLTLRVMMPAAQWDYVPVGLQKFGLTGATCEQLAGVNATFTHAWSPTPRTCPGVTSVAMFWKYPSILSGDQGIVASYNEPDRTDQANLTPYEGAVGQPAIEEAAKNVPILLSPQVSHEGLYWLPEFRKEHVTLYGRTPRMDGIAVHCYWNTADDCWEKIVVPALQMAEDWDAWAGVWITEFHFTPGEGRSWGDTWAEARDFICRCEAEPGVAAYFWYKAQPGSYGGGTFDGVSWAPLYEYVPGKDWQRTWIANQLRALDCGTIRR